MPTEQMNGLKNLKMESLKKMAQHISLMTENLFLIRMKKTSMKEMFPIKRKMMNGKQTLTSHRLLKVTKSL